MLRLVAFFLAFAVTGAAAQDLVRAGEALPAIADAAGGEDPSPHSEAFLVGEVATVEPGVPFTVALRLTMEPGWHSYWRNPGDAGQATEITWALPDGFKAGPIQWPAPERIEVAPFVSYGYSDEVLLLTEITPPPTLDQPIVRLVAEAQWLICADICLPAEQRVALTLAVGEGERPSTWAPAFRRARTLLPVQDQAWSLRGTHAASGWRLHVTPPPAWQGDASEAYFYADSTGVVQHAAPQPIERTREGFVVTVPRSEFAQEDPQRLTGVLVAPENEQAEPFVLSVDVPLVDGEAQAPTYTSRASLWGTLLFAFAGGLLLNLMPCVFPILSIKILGFVQGRENDRALLRKHGLVFGVGVLVSFLALAGALLVLRAAGEEIGWGFQLQNPWIVGGLTLLLVAIGLNLAGVFEVGFGLSTAGGRFDRGEGLGGAFASGVLATLVATPCAAPFMGAALGVALTLPAMAALLVFAVLGMGMALPYVLLAAFPAWLERLPRAGPWMETLKQVLAFPMLLTAIWLVWVFGMQTGLNGAILLLVASLLIAVGAWALGRWGVPAIPTRARLWGRGIAVVSVALAVFALGAGVQQKQSEKTVVATSQWQVYDPAEVERLHTSGQPVFVDFTAAWCLSCQANKAIALHTETVQEAFQARGVTLFRADWTNRDPVITEALARYGRSGVPLYVLYPGDGSRPILLPEILTPGLVIEALERIPTSTTPVASLSLINPNPDGYLRKRTYSGTFHLARSCCARLRDRRRAA